MVDEELSAIHILLKSRTDVIETEMGDVRNRLSRLCNALETGKIELDDLAPRIKELRTTESELSSAKIQLEAEMVVEGIETVDINDVKSYVEGIQSVLDEIDSHERKSFLRSFVKRIVIKYEKAVVHYKLPIPTDEKRR